jgi:hypothetical protein
MTKKKPDHMKEFRGKTKLTEREVNLFKRRINDGKLKPSNMRSGGYALTQAQINKGISWLRKKYNELGYRELLAIGWDGKGDPWMRGKKPNWKAMRGTRIRLIDFYNIGHYGGAKFYVPYYRVTRGKHSFEYAAFSRGGRMVHIMG